MKMETRMADFLEQQNYPVNATLLYFSWKEMFHEKIEGVSVHVRKLVAWIKMAENEKRNRWLFTKEQLANSPSRAHGVDATKELSYRQQTANFIQDMGRRLGVSQLVINTAIVYMHRFFMHHSFKVYHRNNIAAAFLFLACKVEEQPRKLEHVVTVAYGCLHRGEPMIDPSSEEYKRLTNEVIKNELLILQTLGFDVQIRHPHPDVVKCTQLVRASKDLAQTAYFMAHNSLLLTTMCLQYRPSVVACVCIHLACQWKGIEIPHSSDNKAWWHYVDDSVTPELLNSLAHEFVEIYESCPSRFRAKIDSKQQASSTSDKSAAKKTIAEDEKKLSSHSTKHSTPSSKSDGSLQAHSSMKNDFAKPPVKSGSSKHSSHSSGQKPPHKQPKPPFTPQQLAAATLSKPKPPKIPAPTHEGSSKEHSNHSQESVASYTGTDDTVKLKQKSGDAISLEAYKQKKAKQNEMLQQQQQLQQVPTQHQHRHPSKRLMSGADEHRSKKLKESLTDAQKKELYKRHLLKQQQQLASLQQLPPLPPPLPKGSSGNSPPPPPPPLR